MALKDELPTSFNDIEDQIERMKFSFEDTTPLFEIKIETYNGEAIKYQIYSNTRSDEIATEFCEAFGLPESDFNYIYNEIENLRQRQTKTGFKEHIDDIDERDFGDEASFSHGVKVSLVNAMMESVYSITKSEAAKQTDKSRFTPIKGRNSDQQIINTSRKNGSLNEGPQSKTKSITDYSRKDMTRSKSAALKFDVAKADMTNYRLFAFDVLDTKEDKKLKQNQRRYSSAIKHKNDKPPKAYERLYTDALVKRKMPRRAVTESEKKEEESIIIGENVTRNGVRIGTELYERSIKDRNSRFSSMERKRFDKEKIVADSITFSPKISEFKSFDSLSIFSVIL